MHYSGSVGNYIGRATGSGDVRETIQVELKSIEIQWIMESVSYYDDTDYIALGSPERLDMNRFI
jgi:hypothetical protein